MDSGGLVKLPRLKNQDFTLPLPTVPDDTFIPISRVYFFLNYSGTVT